MHGEVANLTAQLPDGGQAARRNGNLLEVRHCLSRLFGGSAEGLGDLRLDRSVFGTRLQAAQLRDGPGTRGLRQRPEAGVADLRRAGTDAGKLLEACVRRRSDSRWQRVVFEESAAPDEASEEVAVSLVNLGRVRRVPQCVDMVVGGLARLSDLSEH